MKRLSLLSIFGISVLLLSGCLQVTVGIGIDEWHSSYLSYSVALDVTGVDPMHHDALADAMHRLGWHYQENLGFTVGVNTNSSEYTLIMRKSSPNGSFSEAFESLKNMLTDENISIFSQVDMSFESFNRQESYIIGAVMDIDHMLRISGSGQLPEDVQTELSDGIRTSGGEILLTIPASEVEAHSHEIEEQYRTVAMAVPLDFSGQTEFELSGSVLYDEEGLQTGASDGIIEELTKTRLTILITILCILALLLIILIVRLIGIYKHNHLFD